MSHLHRFRRLSDVAIYCECGEIRESPFRPLPTIPIYPIGTPYTPPVIPPTTPRPNVPWHPEPPLRIEWKTNA